jgi:hypothetical protein
MKSFLMTECSDDDLGERSKSKSRKRFTKEDDEKLMKIIHEKGSINWIVISNLMKNKTPRQCKERYEYYLCPNINQRPFTQEEDLLLIQQYQLHGSKWVSIGFHFPGRTDSQIKNRFHKLKRYFVKMENYFTSYNYIVNQLTSQDVVKTQNAADDTDLAEAPQQNESIFHIEDFSDQYQDEFKLDNWF